MISAATTNVILTIDHNAGHSASSNPFDVLSPAFQVEALGNGAFRLSFTGLPTSAYRIQYAENLLDPNWQDLVSLSPDPLGHYEYTDHPPANSPARFYRWITP